MNPVACARCEAQFRLGKKWAVLWDGRLWRVYDYLGGMPWGPFCTKCIGPAVNFLNAGKHVPGRDPLLLTVSGMMQLEKEQA